MTQRPDSTPAPQATDGPDPPRRLPPRHRRDPGRRRAAPDLRRLARRQRRARPRRADPPAVPPGEARDPRTKGQRDARPRPGTPRGPPAPVGAPDGLAAGGLRDLP